MNVATPNVVLYDPRYHTFESWSSLMVEAYAGQQLQIGVKEDKWHDWATGLMAIDVFQSESLPNPDLFEEWNVWAAELLGAMNARA